MPRACWRDGGRPPAAPVVRPQPVGRAWTTGAGTVARRRAHVVLGRSPLKGPPVNEIVGVSMTTIMVVLIVLLGLCLLAVAWVAWRRPVIFRLGVRNIPRRKAQTVLIVAGLMLSTLIVAAALGTGDTIDYSTSTDVFDRFGHLDELVVASQDVEASAAASATTPLDAADLARLEDAVRGNPDIDGLLPFLETRVPIVNEAASLAEPDVLLIGLDPARLAAFGGLRATDGEAIDLAALSPGGVVLSERLADLLGAKAGDALTTFYNNTPATLTVAAVAENAYLTGVRCSASSGLEGSGLVMPLTELQTLTGQPNRLTAVAVSNAGGVRDGLERSQEVTAALRTALAGQGLGVDPIKETAVDQARLASTLITALFLILGLFTITAGIVLIVLIFTMLAAERRPEMGMARAVGAHRSQLVQQFVAEGSGYAVLAGLVGAALGVLATIGIAYAMTAIFGQYLPIEPYVTPRSMVVAYCLGVVITFATVVVASWRISRLNVVAAVRDIPDVASPARKKRTLVWAGVLLLVGGLLTLLGTASGQAFAFQGGMSLLPFGLALILRFFSVSARPVFTAVGLALLVFWLLPEDLFTRIFGEYDGDIEMFFLSGIFMVVGATIVIVNNLDLLLAGVSWLGGMLESALPAVRTAIAYPGAAKGRTGMTIAMFSLIVFSLVMIATMSENFANLFLGDEANAGWDVRADSAGANVIADFTDAIRAKGVDTAGVAAVGVTRNPSTFFSQVRLAAATDPGWKEYAVYGIDEGFIRGSELAFQQRASGYYSDAAIVQALLTEPGVAVVDVRALPDSGTFGAGGDLLEITDLGVENKVFEPITIELANPRTGGVTPVRVIGVIDSKIGSLFGLFTAQATIDAVYPSTTLTSYFVRLDDPERSAAVAKEIEAALLTNGVQATSIRDELKAFQRQNTGFLYIIQGADGCANLQRRRRPDPRLPARTVLPPPARGGTRHRPRRARG